MHQLKHLIEVDFYSFRLFVVIYVVAELILEVFLKFLDLLLHFARNLLGLHPFGLRLTLVDLLFRVKIVFRNLSLTIFL